MCPAEQIPHPAETGRQAAGDSQKTEGSWGLTGNWSAGSSPSGGEPQPAEDRPKIHIPAHTEGREGMNTAAWEVAWGEKPTPTKGRGKKLTKGRDFLHSQTCPPSWTCPLSTTA